jgi:Uma2 family endonuclease
MGMPAWRYYTAADLQKMPEDGNKYEVVHGELLVSPSPRPWHQFVLGRLVQRVAGYLDQNPIGVGAPGGDLSWSDDSLVIPDFLVCGLEEARTMAWARMTHPLLVVEILSPSTARNDRFTKRRLYQEAGVPLYWLVDADARVIEVWTPESPFPVTEHEEVRWPPEGAVEPLVIRLGELFRAL